MAKSGGMIFYGHPDFAERVAEHGIGSAGNGILIYESRKMGLVGKLPDVSVRVSVLVE
jgi:hypothetical protein